MSMRERLASNLGELTDRVATLEAQEVTVIGSGTTVPATNAQNQMTISNATPAWILLAAPSAQHQILITGADPYTPVWTARFDATVPNTIEPDDAAAAGSATVAARRDHEHGIVCAVAVATGTANAEGSGTSFSRDDHVHLLHVHDHTGDTGDGGQLDWDDVWSDAIHDHSAAGEGGSTLGFTALTGAGVDVPDGWYIGIGAALERIIFDAAGDISVMGASVGIGTVAPEKELHIAGAASANIVLERTGTAQLGYLAHIGSTLQLSVNRDIAGAFSDAAQAAASINFIGAAADSHIDFYTADANNTAPTLGARIDKVGIFSLERTTGALLLHRLTTTQRNALTAVNGMVLYNSTTAAINAREDSTWVAYLVTSGARAMTGDLNLGSNDITNVGAVDGVDVSDHDARHERAGADEIDGDHLDIDWNPTNYTPSAAPAEAASIDDLTAHLKGLDDWFGGEAYKQYVFTFDGYMVQDENVWKDVAGDFYYDNSKYPTGNATWRVTLRIRGSGPTAYIRLYDMSDPGVVATLSTTLITYQHLSASVSLDDGHYYRIQMFESSGSDFAEALGSYLEW